ncbi:hypothetical protein IC575_014394 [Cucumis melo]
MAYLSHFFFCIFIINTSFFKFTKSLGQISCKLSFKIKKILSKFFKKYLVCLNFFLKLLWKSRKAKVGEKEGMKRGSCTLI